MSNIKKILFVILITTPVLVGAQAGLGGTPDQPGLGGTPPPAAIDVKLKNPIKYDTFSQFAEAVIKTAVKVLLPFVVIAFMVAGFLFIKAQGNAEEISKAKTAMWYSIVGAFILLGSLGFAQIIGKTVETLAP